MRLVERWKVRREFSRILDQLMGVGRAPYELVARHFPRHNSLGCDLRAFEPAKRVAVFVVHQPNGVAPTVHRTARHLSDQGFATLVVSNGRLSEADRGALSKAVDLVIERPNFGYDFGAYKVAICALLKLEADFEALLVLNDSVWFPARQDSGMLRQMAEHEADVVSAQIFGEALFPDTARRIILGSYCMMFKRAALRSRQFSDFWNAYRMSSSKERTLRRGERALSRILQESHLTCAGLYSQRMFEDVLPTLDEPDLRTCVADLVVLAPRHREMRQRLLREPGSADWAAAARALVVDVSRTKNFIGSSPCLSFDRLGVDVIKKNNEMLYRLARRHLIRWKGGEILIDPLVREEISRAVARDRLPRELDGI